MRGGPPSCSQSYTRTVPGTPEIIECTEETKGGLVRSEAGDDKEVIIRQNKDLS